MKIYLNTPWKGLASLLVAITYLFIVSAAKAQTDPPLPNLLIVNITNPNAVIITSTGAEPSMSLSPSGSIGAGIDLMGLLGTAAPTSNDSNFIEYNLTSTLTTGASSSEQLFNADVYDALNGQNNLNLFYSSTDTTDFFPMTFSTSASAFAPGSLTTDLSGLTLLSSGYYDIETGYNGSATAGAPYTTPNEVIGTYEIIDTPEPPSWMLAFMVTALLAVLRFRVRRA